jgi:predicted DNA binding CopG/RHH family protein
MKNRIAREIPKFKNEDAERRFWAKADTSEYFDWSKPLKNPIMPNLRPSSKSISIRIPQYLLDDLKMIAHKKDMPYQALMKHYLSDKIREEFAH